MSSTATSDCKGGKGEFDEATGQVWPLNIGQVYSSLQRLERDDLVALDAEGDDRRRYRITAEGLGFLRASLLRPVPRDGETRDEVTMKVLMAAVSGAARVDELVARQREETMAALQRFTRHKAATSPSDFAALVQLDRLILRCRAELDWLDLVETRSESHDETASERHRHDHRSRAGPPGAEDKHTRRTVHVISRAPRSSTPDYDDLHSTATTATMAPTTDPAMQALELAPLGASGGSGVPPVVGPGDADEATQRDDRVGQADESIDHALAAFVAALQPVERVDPRMRAFHDPALPGLDRRGCALDGDTRVQVAVGQQLRVTPES